MRSGNHEVRDVGSSVRLSVVVLVAMVEVGYVRVGVSERHVLMPMRVHFGGLSVALVRMAMVGVMRVFVHVLDGVVAVYVLVVDPMTRSAPAMASAMAATCAAVMGSEKIVHATIAPTNGAIENTSWPRAAPESGRR